MPTASSVIADMKLNDLGLPGSNPNSSWSRGGFVVMGADFRGQATPTWWDSDNKFYGFWNAVMPWFVFWDGQGHQANLNTRVMIYDLETYFLISGSWTKFGGAIQLGGEAFRRDLVNSSNNPDVRNESGGGLSVRIQPGTPDVYHGWGNFLSVNGADIRGVHVRYKMKLIKHSETGPDDRHLAAYCVHAGADAYVYPGQRTSDFLPANYTPSIGGSKFKRATTIEQSVCMTTINSANNIETGSIGGKQSYFVMSEAAFLANLPPGVTLTEAAPSPSPTPSPTPSPSPTPAPVIGKTIGNLEIVGDSLHRGDVPNFYAPLEELKNSLIDGGYSFTFVGDYLATPGNVPTQSVGGRKFADVNNSAALSAISNLAPKTLLFSIGTNDMGTANIGTATTNCLNAVEAACSRTMTRMFAAVPFRLSWFDNAKFTEMRGAYIAWVNAQPSKRYLIELDNAALAGADLSPDGTHWTSSGASKVANVEYNRINGVVATVGRKEIWFSGDTVASIQDGTRENPINSIVTLREAIQTYGPTGIDLRKLESSVWTGIFPEEAFQYTGTTIKGNNWLSDPGHFEGGVRKTDWISITGGPAGKQLWRCTSMTQQASNVSLLQVGAVSIDDAIVAHRRFTTLSPTVTLMAAFPEAYTFDVVNNVLYLLLPTGVNPNTLTTMVGQTAECFRNYNFASQGNTRTGIFLEHLRFKRYSGYPIDLSNLPGIQVRNCYGKHIGGRYQPSGPEGKFLQLYGGCDRFIVEDIRCDGVEQVVFSSQVRSGSPTQSSGVARRISGSHVGDSIVELTTQIPNSGVMDNLVVDDISGSGIGKYRTDSLRPDASPKGLFFIGAPISGTSRINGTRVSRAVAVDSPLGIAVLGDSSSGSQITFDGCQGRANPALGIDTALLFGHQGSTGIGTDLFRFRACAFEGYTRGLKNGGGPVSFAVEVRNNVFKGITAAGIDMNGIANTTLTVQNNLGHTATTLVRAINGVGSSLVNEGGSYVSTGTSLGYTAVGTDTTAGADPGFVGNSVGKPPSGSALYGGGTALNSPLFDRLGMNFLSPWARGAYAQFSASDGFVGTSPPVAGDLSGFAIWEQKLTTAGDIAYLAEQVVTTTPSAITGITNLPTTISIVVNEIYPIFAIVQGTGQFSGAVKYSLISGSSVSISSTGEIKGVAVGTSVVRAASSQAPTVFWDIVVTVSNFSEFVISAVPASINLSLVGGTGSVAIVANGKNQAGLSAISSNSLVATAAKSTGFDGKLDITPVSVGTTTILVTKVSRFGGQMTITVPVTVTTGTVAGDVTAIDTAGNHAIFVNQAPYLIRLLDQNGNPIVDREISVSISQPGFVAAPHVVLPGSLLVYPVGVGIATVSLELLDATAGRIRKEFTIEVMPVGGSVTPTPPPPAPIAPTEPDPGFVA